MIFGLKLHFFPRFRSLCGGGSLKKSKRGRRKGAKNRLKLDPDTGQLVRTLIKRPRKQCPNKSGGNNSNKKFRENTPLTSSTVNISAVSTSHSELKFQKKIHFQKYKINLFDIFKSTKTHFLLFQK